MSTTEVQSFARTLSRRVSERGPASLDDARRWIASVFAALGAMLTSDERDRVAPVLPANWAHALRHRSYQNGMTLEDFYHACDVERGPVPARERVQVVCAALGELLPNEALDRLNRALPAEVAHLFAVRRPEGIPRSRRPPAGHSLASARPGSRHPVSESAPPGAQHDSVAVANPHGDSKISSSSGTTQERLHESLAEGGAMSDHTFATQTDPKR